MAENRVLEANFAFSILTVKARLEALSKSPLSYIDVATFDLKTSNGVERDLVMQSEIEGLALGISAGDKIEVPTEIHQPRKWIQDTNYQLGNNSGENILARRRATLNIFGTETQVSYTFKIGDLTSSESQKSKLPFPAREYIRSRFEELE